MASVENQPSASYTDKIHWKDSVVTLSGKLVTLLSSQQLFHVSC